MNRRVDAIGRHPFRCATDMNLEPLCQLLHFRPVDSPENQDRSVGQIADIVHVISPHVFGVIEVINEASVGPVQIGRAIPG